jgi:hypothetical protein
MDERGTEAPVAAMMEHGDDVGRKSDKNGDNDESKQQQQRKEQDRSTVCNGSRCWTGGASDTVRRQTASVVW